MLRNHRFIFGRTFATCKRISPPLRPTCWYKATLTKELCDNRKFSSSSKLLCEKEDENYRTLKYVKLMDTLAYIYPSPWKILKSIFYEYYIKNKYNKTFSITGIVKGGTQAMLHISSFLSKGEFEQIEGLIEPNALREIKSNYFKLTQWQRDYILVYKEDLFRKYLYELKVRKNQDTGKEYAEALVVFHGFHGYAGMDWNEVNIFQHFQQNAEKVFVCNYKFIKELTKDLEKDWMIHELNHFQAGQYIK